MYGQMSDRHVFLAEIRDFPGVFGRSHDFSIGRKTGCSARHSSAIAEPSAVAKRP
jgi:hypothetical protein